MSEMIGELYKAARREIGKVIVGQESVIIARLLSLFAGGHVLIEGDAGNREGAAGRSSPAPFRAPFAAFSCDTPDLMPADITGTNLFDPRDQLAFHSGRARVRRVHPRRRDQPAPADARSPARSDAERHVTMDGVTIRCRPFSRSSRRKTRSSRRGPTRCRKLTRPFHDEAAGRLSLRRGGNGNSGVHQRGVRSEDLDRFGIQTVGGPAEFPGQEDIRQRTIRDELLAYIVRRNPSDPDQRTRRSGRQPAFRADGADGR